MWKGSTESVRKYADIIELPHYQSKTRPPMARGDRAAQFAPFAALTGHEDAIEETAKKNCEFWEDEYKN